MDARRWDRLSLGVTNGLKAWLWYGVAEYVLHTAGSLLFQVQRGGAPGGRTRVSSFGILPLSPIFPICLRRRSIRCTRGSIQVSRRGTPMPSMRA